MKKESTVWSLGRSNGEAVARLQSLKESWRLRGKGINGLRHAECEVSETIPGHLRCPGSQLVP